MRPQSQPASASAQRTQLSAGPYDAGTRAVEPSSASAEDTYRDAGPAPRTGPVLRPEIVEQLLEPELANMTPEQVMTSYASLGLVLKDSHAYARELVSAATPTERVRFAYTRKYDETQWRFVNAVLQVIADTPQHAGEIYTELATLVGKKLGKPTQVVEHPPYLGKTFKFGAQLEVSVGAVMAPEPQPYAAMTIVVPQRK